MNPVRYNDSGEAVARLQRALVERGYDLPRHGIDGHLGDEGWEALQRFAEDEGIPWQPEVPASVLVALERPLQRSTTPPVTRPTPKLDGIRFYDLRDRCSDPHCKSKTIDGKSVRRRAASIRAITIHQTAVEFGVAPYQLLAAGGDRELALARRAHDVACHALAFREGFVSLPVPLRWYVYHGNELNAHSLGLEIEGNYPGVAGGSTANGKPASELTPTVVESARAALRRLVDEGRNEGCPIEFIHAHRQSSSSRRADPGEALWRAVVLDYAVPVLGLKTEPRRIWGTGRPIPKAWDPAGVGAP